MDLSTLVLIFAGLIGHSHGDVGFTDKNTDGSTVPYLMVAPSNDMQERTFRLSADSAALKHINLQSDRAFNADTLTGLIVSADISDDLKIELYQMLSMSLMSTHKSVEFLEALSKILSEYKSEKPDL